MLRIGVYCRVSTEKQVKGGVSLDMQQALIKKRIMNEFEDDYEIVMYVDDGYSGKNLNRPAMNKLLHDVEGGKIKMVCAYDLSRLSRDIFDTERLLEFMSLKKVDLLCLCESVSMDTAIDRFKTRLTSLNNTYERERISERTKDSLRNIAEGGRYASGGKAPYGYKRDEKKALVISDSEARIVKMIFELASKGESFYEIARIASSEAGGRKFDVRSVRDIIENKRYSGHYIYGGKDYANVIPQIVSDELQEKAVRYVERKSPKNHEYIFDGLLYCECCNCDMVCSMSYGKSHKKYYYYKCLECGNAISQIDLDRYFININLEEKDPLPDYIKKSFVRQVAKLKRRISIIKDRYINDVYNEREYLELIIPLSNRIDEIRCKEKASSKNKSYSEITNNSEKKRLIAMKVRRIVVDPKKKEIKKVEYK